MNKLTNTDIIDRLIEIRQIPNICDRHIALKQFQKQYKKSAFYRTTHKKLNMLYYEVSIENLLSLTSLLKSAQAFINGLDLQHFTELMDQVNDQTAETIMEGVTAFSDTGLQDLINKFKKPN